MMKTQTRSAPPPLHEEYAMQIARQVSRNDNSDGYVTATKQVSVSLPLATLASIEVLAKRAGCSRGSMVASLAKVGASLVLQQLNEEDVAEVGEEVSNREQELYEEFDPTEA